MTPAEEPAPDLSAPEERGESDSPGLFRRFLERINFRRPGDRDDLDQEIQDLLEEGEEHGLISSLEEKMINSILEFHDTTASEVMTPAAEIVACAISSSITKLVDLAINSGFTRIPIFQESIDNVAGVVHVKDLLRLCASEEMESGEIADFIRPVNVCSEDRPIVDIMREFQRTKVHISIVADEFGAVRGLVTMEDILEEIVGEIDDEYDGGDDDTFETREDGSVRLHGRVDVEKLEEYFGVTFPEGPYESAGGLVVHLLGRLAKEGDEVDVAGVRLRVEEASNRHIKSILASPPEKEVSPKGG